MSKLWIVLCQEYLNRVRTRGFVIGTLLFPLLMILLMVLPAVLMNVDVEKPARYVVVDSTGVLFAPLAAALADTNEAGARLFQLEPAASGMSDPVQELTADVAADRIGGFFVLGRDLLEGNSQAAFYAKNVADEERNMRLRRTLDQLVRETRIEQSDLAPDQVREIMRPTGLHTFRVKGEGETTADEGHTFFLAYVFGFLFYFSMFAFGAMTLRTTLEEKTQRSAELMVSTVRPFQLMGGKVLGVAGVALTQMAIWFLAGALILTQGSGLPGGLSTVMAQIQQAAPSPFMIVSFFVFFILGFLLYSGIYVAVGAMVATETEAQQLQLPATMPILISFMMMFLAIRDPNGTVTTVLSLIPLFAPILMMVRITVLTPPAWQILLCVALLIASVAGSMWLSARIFRVGLLMYGKRPDLPELLKWVRYG
ncbi:MAG: ABC transporter permease [Candidatus Eisenbacteria bacterium]|uniref:ABC transporter permease n=1 Tax=Eiseniibacteriota bacterium TaxID=2212470 RepID=A0A956RQH9_UNCEI|nr:ABC transporter permease [Candidatus Eisenbacteria bacterium]